MTLVQTPDEHPTIRGTGTALPGHRLGQSELAELFKRLLPAGAGQAGLERAFREAGVEHRHLALPANEYAALSGLKSRSAAWLSAALPLAENAIGRALA